ncbi:uncharacterized protein UV8b_05734 [Ustilaginoidea virens]|uniref:Uncharacterized protein n=1 Tax=Ustilaginoidea virens TaxID=1159556 RepID=A0A8E5HTY9_USTVR|nr:uncharacterized protein UV8b_05734 [Ustilaginoidea virens]QUC21491.1 hypothetical protein UV8b_05734 [Ustilaginoidea virens]
MTPGEFTTFNTFNTFNKHCTTITITIIIIATITLSRINATPTRQYIEELMVAGGISSASRADPATVVELQQQRAYKSLVFFLGTNTHTYTHPKRETPEMPRQESREDGSPRTPEDTKRLWAIISPPAAPVVGPFELSLPAYIDVGRFVLGERGARLARANDALGPNVTIALVEEAALGEGNKLVVGFAQGKEGPFINTQITTHATKVLTLNKMSEK